MPTPPAAGARPDITFVQAVDDFDRWHASVEQADWAHAIAKGTANARTRYADTFVTLPDFAGTLEALRRWRLALVRSKGLKLMPYAEAAQRFGAYREETGSDGAHRALSSWYVMAWNELVGHIASCLVCTLSSSLESAAAGLSRSQACRGRPRFR